MSSSGRTRIHEGCDYRESGAMVTDLGLSASALSELVRGRRSIRAFRPEALPPKVIEELLEDALWAPSPHNSQPWRFTVLSEAAERARLAEAMAEQLAGELSADGVAPDMIERQTTRSRARIVEAPVAVLLSLEPDGLVTYPDQRRNALEWRMAVQSVGALLQTLFLLAATRGIGSCWMAAPMYCPEAVRASLGLPQSFEPQALALLGYGAHEGKIRARRPLEQVVDWR